MPRDITITLKDGTTHVYKGAPDDVTPEAVTQRAQKEFGQEVASLDGGRGPSPAMDAAIERAGSAPLVDTAVDMARAIPGGLAKGASAVAGLPGDIDRGLTFLADKALGVTDSARQQMNAQRGNIGGVPQVPNSEQIAGAASSPFGGFYEPKTTAGEYAETVASFAPNAVAPGGPVARAMRVAVPGIASETAGQATKGSPYEPVARAVGALGGGIAQGVGEGVMAARNNPAPSLQELGSAKKAAYQAADQAGVVITPQAWQKFAGDVNAKLTQGGLVHPELHKNALAALKTIETEAAAGRPISLSRADVVRQVVNDAIDSASAPGANGGDLRRASEVKGMLDDFLDGLTPSDVVAGDAAVAVPILKEARSLAQREFKAKKIQELIDLAENQASSNFTGAGKEQALRVQFKNFNAKLIKDPQYAKSFSPEEREAIAAVAKGGPIGNALRFFGKLAPTGVISGGAGVGGGAYAGGLIGGPPGAAIGAAAVPALGALSRGGATIATERNARLAAELMRRGGPPVNPGATQIPQNVLLGTLLSQAGR